MVGSRPGPIRPPDGQVIDSLTTFQLGGDWPVTAAYHVISKANFSLP
jgi:hypothetical protein